MAHFTIDINVTDSDFAGNGKLRADRVFHFFQDSSEVHVNALGVGPDDLIKRDYIWVLTKMTVRYVRDMEPGRKYICTTYPVFQKRATFKRDYYINYAEDGADPEKALVIGASQWCILNFKTRKLEKTDIVFESAPDEKNMIEGVFPKVHGEDLKLIAEHEIVDEDIDYNGHCNNTVYIAEALKSTGKDVEEELFVNFASETRLGDRFEIFGEEQEGGTFIEGRRPDGSRVVQIIFR